MITQIKIWKKKNVPGFINLDFYSRPIEWDHQTLKLATRFRLKCSHVAQTNHISCIQGPSPIDWSVLECKLL